MGQFICVRLNAEYFIGEVLRVYSLGTSGSPRPFPGISKVKIIFITTLKMLFAFSSLSFPL